MKPARPVLEPDVDVVLASASPRRLELLHRIGITPAVRPTDIDETPRPGESPADLVLRLARSKCAAAVAALEDPDALVIAADTIVVDGTDVLNKPTDDNDAADMLRSLSGRSHQVLTGIALARGDDRAEAVIATTVTFRALREDQIEAYVASGEPADKAGAYGIQGAAGAFVERVEGSDSNVIGLPLATVVELIGDLGISVRPQPRP